MGIIARQSIKGTIATYIGVAVGFFTTFFVLTRFLTTEEVGLARVLLDAATLFVGLAQLGTSSSIIRFFPYFSTDDKRSHGFFFWMLIVPLVGFLFFAALFWLLRTPIETWFGDKSPMFVDYYYFVLPLAFFMLFETVAETCSNVTMRIVLPRTVREVGVRVGLLICYLLYAFRYLSMDGFVVALCINYALAATIDLIYFFLTNKGISLKPDILFLKQNPSLVRNYLLYTLFLIVSALASVLAPALSSFFITAKMGLSFTGIFAIATYMATVVGIPYRSLTAIAAPQLADSLKKQDTQQTATLLKQVTNNTLLVSCTIFLLIWLNIDLIYHILPNGTTYVAARTDVFILSLSQLLLATFSFSLSTLNYGKYYAFSLLFSTILTITAIAFNQWLVPVWGMHGAAMSNLLSYAIYFACILTTVRLTMKQHPFCISQLITIALFAAIIIVNEVVLNSMSEMNIWLSSVVRTTLFIGLYLFVAYFKQLSPEINALLRSLFIHRH
ncbi:MAG: lipopolysaccharide biosynthesis protein [Paludibacteraceae bacterium]|nr:lipopolysaccharide biosynthesis protein [Paludibacteraceae bacterium]